jgi:alanine dehydrogenase
VPDKVPLELRFISGYDVETLALSRADIFSAVEAAVRAQGRGRVVLEPRTHLVPPNDGAGHFNVLRGHLGPQRVSGIKVVGDFVTNYQRGLPSELGLVTLYDPDTGAPLAIIDATDLTAARTGAMTALGARHLAHSDAKVLGHIGARGTAWWNVAMLDDLFDLSEIRVTSARAESRERFAAELGAALGKEVRPVATPEEAMAGADIMVEASRLTRPEVLLRTEWVTAGSLVVPYGTISAVELSLTEVMDKVVVDDWEQAKAGRFGALREHIDQGLITRESLHAELGDIVAGSAAGRESEAERILFWHRGLATTDLAVAHLILRRAEEQDLGTLLSYRP